MPGYESRTLALLFEKSVQHGFTQARRAFPCEKIGIISWRTCLQLWQTMQTERLAIPTFPSSNEERSLNVQFLLQACEEVTAVHL